MKRKKTPADYGLVGDGMTDDTAAIQAMVDDGAYALTPGKRYVISKTIRVRKKRGGR